MHIKNESLIINAVTIALMVLTLGLFGLLMEKNSQVRAVDENRYYSTLLVDELRGSSEELTRQVRVYAATGADSAEAAYNTVLAVRNGAEPRSANAVVAPGERRVLLDLLREYGVTDEEFALVQEANKLSDALVNLEVEAMNAVKGVFKDASGAYTVHGAPDQALAIRLVFSDAYITATKQIMAPMDQFERHVRARTNAHVAAMMQEQSQVAVGVMAILALVLGIAVFNMVYIRSVVVRPLSVMMAILEAIFSGATTDLRKRVSDTSANEIGGLGRYINQTLDKITALIRVIKTQSAVLLGNGADLAAHMSETASAVNEIAATIENIKQRILYQNAAVNQTGQSMEALIATIDALNSDVTGKTAGVATSLSSIEQLITNIQTVKTSLEQNAASITALASASEAGHKGLETVSTDIQEIARQSQGLLEINAVMATIAAQTNLLSMNAAIEAAHAGEAGKGFAVVAAEIRKLAENSANQSKTTSSVLKKITDSIDMITANTTTALQTFEAIQTGVSTVSDQAATIRTVMDAQHAGTTEIRAVMSVLNAVTDQVKASAATMLNQGAGVITESHTLAQATQEITNGMNEMATGAQQINQAVNGVNSLSDTNKTNISVLVEEIGQFQFD